MFDSTEELLQKIRLGEDTPLELKDVRFRGSKIDGPSRDDLANEIAAIANTYDGVLLLGVDDKTKEIFGIPVDKLDLVERYGKNWGLSLVLTLQYCEGSSPITKARKQAYSISEAVSAM